MKRLFVIFVSLFYSLNAFSSPCQNEKIYVSPETLNVNSRGIFLNLENQWYKTDALFSDESGIFIRNMSPQENGCRKGYVPCRNCDRCVNMNYDICPHCERPV